MSNSNATKYHEIKVGILDNTCFKENVPTFEILVGWILRLGLNFWVINVALYGWKCDPAYPSLGLGIRKLQPFKCRKMVPISNTGPVPKTVTWYWHFVCTEAQSPIFPYGGTFYKKSASTSWYLTVTSWNLDLVHQRIDNLFQISTHINFGVKNS